MNNDKLHIYIFSYMGHLGTVVRRKHESAILSLMGEIRKHEPDDQSFRMRQIKNITTHADHARALRREHSGKPAYAESLDAAQGGILALCEDSQVEIEYRVEHIDAYDTITMHWLEGLHDAPVVFRHASVLQAWRFLSERVKLRNGETLLSRFGPIENAEVAGVVLQMLSERAELLPPHRGVQLSVCQPIHPQAEVLCEEEAG